MAKKREDSLLAHCIARSIIADAGGERTAYRNQAEFRELWTEFETPNELARQIVPRLRGKVDATKLPSSVVVTA